MKRTEGPLPEIPECIVFDCKPGTGLVMGTLYASYLYAPMQLEKLIPLLIQFNYWGSEFFKPKVWREACRFIYSGAWANCST